MSPENSHNSLRNIYPAPHYDDFDPYNNKGDQWLYETSHGDSQLLFMLLTKEVFYNRLNSGADVSPDKDNIESINDHIQKRTAEVEQALDQPPRTKV